MRIFISYASQQRPIAERLSHALRNEGHVVFFDRDSLLAGEAYAGAIQREIQACDLFVFLISPEALSERYPVSELAVVQKSRPVPGNHVLPVMTVPVPIDAVPGYLRPLTILYPKGDLIADIVHRIADIAAKRRRRHFLFTTVALVVIAIMGFTAWRISSTLSKPARSITLLRSLSVFREADQDSEILGQLKPGEELSVVPRRGNPNWVAVQTKVLNGWAMAQDIIAQEADSGSRIAIGQGYGYQGSYWQLFFTSPQKEGRPPNQFGIDIRFSDAIGRVKKSLDIAVFELNNKNITDALIEAYQRGVTVRVVTGTLGFEEKGQTFGELKAAGIPIVVRPNHDEFMHNKFAIMDGKTVWTGSWNYTDGATYKNNENAIALDGQDIAGRYQAVFNQMFDEKLFGTQRGPVKPLPVLSHNVVVMFAPEDPIVPELLNRIRSARQSIEFMAFSLTLGELADALRERSGTIAVRGILEQKLARSSKASKSLCESSSRVALRFGSSPHFLHHDVFVIDGQLVITGSASFGHHGTEVNDENVVLIPDVTLAQKYRAEFSRLWEKGATPDAEFCNVQM